MTDQAIQFQEPNLVLMAYRLEQQEVQIDLLKTKMQLMEQEIVEREATRARQERRQLVAGISFLGTVVTALATIIWSYRSVIFRG